MADLEKIIGRDIKGAERHLRKCEQDVSQLQAQLQAILAQQKQVYDAIIEASQKAWEAGAYLQRLREIEIK